MDSNRQEKLIALWETLSGRLNEEELRTLCFTLRIDYDDLPGEGKAAKARELVAHCERHNRLSELVARYRKSLPEVEWPEITDHPPSVENVQVIYAKAVHLYVAEHKLHAVRLLLQEVVRLDPSYEDAARLLAEVEQQMQPVLASYAKADHLYVVERNLHAARLLLQEVVRLDPSYEDAARLLAEVEQQMQREMWPRVKDRLRDPIWQGIGAIVTILACMVAVVAIPPVRRLLWPAATPTLTPTSLPPSATPTLAAGSTLTPSPTRTLPPPPSPTLAPTCPYQGNSDQATLMNLVQAEAQAANKGNNGGVEIIQLIFAPTAVISNAIEAREWWTNPVDRYTKLFAGTTYTEVEHFDTRQVGFDTKGNITYLTSGSRGLWRTGSGAWTPYTNTSHLNAATPFGSDHWTFGRNSFGCWVITRFVFNAGHVPFPP